MLLAELGVHSQTTPILWCDHLAATYLGANLVLHARTKHVGIDYHFIRKKVSSGAINVQFIHTQDQIADVFTKALPTAHFDFSNTSCMFRPSHIHPEGAC